MTAGFPLESARSSGRGRSRVVILKAIRLVLRIPPIDLHDSDSGVCRTSLGFALTASYSDAVGCWVALVPLRAPSVLPIRSKDARTRQGGSHVPVKARTRFGTASSTGREAGSREQSFRKGSRATLRGLSRELGARIPECRADNPAVMTAPQEMGSLEA